MAAAGVLPAFRPIKITELELTARFSDLTSLSEYGEVHALVRLHGSALGMIRVPIHHGTCSAASLRHAAVEELLWPIVRHLLDDALAQGLHLTGATPGTLPGVAHPPIAAELPSVTVAVCTRDRAHDLQRCLTRLAALDPSPSEVLVIDNAPSSDATERIVAAFPVARYVKERRPGLDWARNRAILEATGDIVAFTDDDVVVDTGWVGAIQRAFAEDPEIAAVTGLVLPLELETEAQELFERYGGFGRGFDRRWYRVGAGESAAALYGGTGRFGTGANMAFRRRLFDDIGLFDPALDVGTVTNGGGDLEMFYRVLSRGHTLSYEPDAIVWHRHRREYGALREQLRNNGIGFYSYLVRSALADPAERWKFARLGAWWFTWWNIRRLAIVLFKPGTFPRDLVLAELAGSVRGLFRYRASRRTADALARRPSDVPAVPPPADSGTSRRPAAATQRATDVPRGSSVRAIDISKPVRCVFDTVGKEAVDVVVLREARLLGTACIENRGRRVSGAELRQVIADAVTVDVLQTDGARDRSMLWAAARQAVVETFAPVARDVPSLERQFDVSIVIATCDRPHDLERALASIAALRTQRRVETIVVDNRPGSGLTAPVAARFPAVRLISESRAGLSYARNAGIAASTGAIVVATDDDVEVPPDWLDTLVAPFADDRVMVVTGNVLPVDLSTRSQRLFEAYGGLGRGMTPSSVDGCWFWTFRQAVPTWKLGGTANAAFRASIFHHPAIGLLDEALGAGTPTGCSEDTDLFYRVLRAGYRIAYEPQAFVWHRHRDTMPALRRQVYAYAKGQVAYQLTTLFRDGDWRAVGRLLVELPRLYAWRVRKRLRRRSAYPLSLVALEIAGTLAGPFALWRSRRRVRRLGRSAPYVPVAVHHIQPAGPPEAIATAKVMVS